MADASPLIALARIGHLYILQALYETVAIPRAVQDEITRHPRGFEGERPAWIDSHEVRARIAIARLERELDRGEAEALVLAAQLGTAILIDEEAGRRVAQGRGLPVTGTLGVLLAAKSEGLIDRVVPVLDSLQSEGFRMSTDLMADLRRIAGE